MNNLSNYLNIVDELESLQCKQCHGSGTINDAKPGDISYRECTCPTCYGAGWKDGVEKRKLVVL